MPLLRRWVRLRSLILVASCLVLDLAACARSQDTTSEIPEAVSYGTAPKFDGEWVGEVGGMPGVLDVGDLGSGRSYAAFRGDDGLTEYVLLMEQTQVSTIGGAQVASNRMVYTWQDGQGARGRGWLLINREETALAGGFGLGDALDGHGDWSFIRVSQ